MTSGKVAATVILSLVGAGGIGVLSASVYNDCKYGLFTPYVSAKDKNISSSSFNLTVDKKEYDELRKINGQSIYNSNACQFGIDIDNLDFEAIKNELKKHLGEEGIKKIEEDIHIRTCWDLLGQKAKSLESEIDLDIDKKLKNKE